MMHPYTISNVPALATKPKLSPLIRSFSKDTKLVHIYPAENSDKLCLIIENGSGVPRARSIGQLIPALKKDSIRCFEKKITSRVDIFGIVYLGVSLPNSSKNCEGMDRLRAKLTVMLRQS